MKKETKIVSLIVDVSGSMSGEAKEATEGIRNIAKQNPDARFNLIEFGTFKDDTVQTIFEKVKAKKLMKYTLKAQAGTPMWDGIGQGLSLLDPKDDNFIVIVTDGGENMSQKWTGMHIKPLIKALEASSNEFLFIGADVEALEDLTDAGFNINRIYTGNNTGVSYNFAASVTSMDASGDELSDLIYKKANTTEGVELSKEKS